MSDNQIWREAAEAVHWYQKPTRLLDDSNPPFYRWYPDGVTNACYNAVDIHVDQGRGEQLAVIYDSPVTGSKHSYTYSQLLVEVSRFAGVLASQGVGKGDRVIVYMPMVPEALIAMLACARIGAIHSVVFGGFASNELAVRIDDATPRVVVSASCGVEPNRIVAYKPLLDQAIELAAHKPGRCIILQRPMQQADLQPGRDLDWEEAMGAAEPVGCTPVGANDPLYILYTSGTTGQPKGAELTHFNLFYNAEYSRSKLMDMSAETVALVTLPLFHSFGQTVLMNAVLGAGGSLVLLPRFTPDDAFALMQGHRVTLFAGVPTMYFALLHHPEADRYDLSALSLCVSGGSAMPVEVMSAFDAKYGVNILEGYGLSETSPVASFNVLDRPKKPGSIGLPIAGVEFRLVDDHGHRVTEPGTPGEILIFGPNVMKGYYNKPEATAGAISKGWFRTGDVATVDEEGYYFIVDRKKDMIIRGGFNVYPREIEEVLYGHPAIAEVAVIGVPHERHGEEVKAIVALKPGKEATAEEIIEYCKEQLAAYKYPRVVEIRDELPKGPTGKILKRALRSEGKG